MRRKYTAQDRQFADPGMGLIFYASRNQVHLHYIRSLNTSQFELEDIRSFAPYVFTAYASCIRPNKKALRIQKIPEPTKPYN